MRREVACFIAGLTLGSAGIGYAAQQTGVSKITLKDGESVLMPDLRWECSYTTRGLGIWNNTPPGPEFSCGRLGALTGGIRTHTDIYYVGVTRGTNANPQRLFKGRRP